MVLLPEWSLRGYLKRGELAEIGLDIPMSVTRSEQVGIYMLYLQSKYAIPKIRAAVEFIHERLAQPNSTQPPR